MFNSLTMTVSGAYPFLPVYIVLSATLQHFVDIFLTNLCCGSSWLVAHFPCSIDCQFDMCMDACHVSWDFQSLP